jgi:RES domain-containing protein
MAARRARDSGLLDAVEALPIEAYDGTVWRVVRDGRDPLACSAVGGRWDDRSFDVLYTSTYAEGAVSEMFFHVAQGQPVIPSLVKYRLFELKASVSACVRVATLDQLAALGLKVSMFGRLSYVDREQEYPRTQEIAEAAYFHGRDGLIVPSARSDHPNLVVFCERAGPAAVEVVTDHGLIDWDDWRQKSLNP